MSRARGAWSGRPGDRRDAYVEGVSGAAAPGATLLVYGFARPPRLAPMHAGVSAGEVRERFGPRGWELVSAEPLAADALEAVGRRASLQFEAWRFRLRRVP